MNEEFAIEPETFNDCSNARYIIEKFGFSQAIFISQVPGNWYKEVYLQLEKLNDGPSKLMAKRLLQNLKASGGLIKGGVDFNPQVSWIENVATCEKEYKGILVSEETNRKDYKCQTISEVDYTFFKADKSRNITRTVENYGKIARRLLEFGPEIYLIDPYFSFHKENNMNLLKKFVEIGLKGKCKKFVIYAGSERNNFEVFEKKMCKNFKGTGASFEFFFVAAHQENFHERYLLSRHGGIQFGRGFETAEDKDLNLRVDALSAEAHEGLCVDYIDHAHNLDIKKNMKWGLIKF